MFEKLSNVTILKTWDSRFTHVITSVDENGACRRTLKYLMVVIEGKWILNIECKQRDKVLLGGRLQIGVSLNMICNYLLGYRDKVTYRTCSSSIKGANAENETSIKDENRVEGLIMDIRAAEEFFMQVFEKENVLGGDGQNVTSNTSLAEGSVINNAATTSIVAESSAEMHETTNFLHNSFTSELSKISSPSKAGCVQTLAGIVAMDGNVTEDQPRSPMLG
ncbi:protein breast cancer susceptibility 1 [Tanacetum coccineum]